MSKNISINFKFDGMRNKGLEIVANMGMSGYAVFEFIISNTDGDKYFAGDHLYKALETMGISESTYWRKLKKLEDTGLIQKYGRGRYIINPKYADMFTKVDAQLYTEFKKNKVFS